MESLYKLTLFNINGVSYALEKKKTAAKESNKLIRIIKFNNND